MRRVIKFGGTSIASPGLLREGARHVARLVEYGEQIAVVVSAPGNLTSELLGAIYAVADGSAAHQPETLSFAAPWPMPHECCGSPSNCSSEPGAICSTKWASRYAPV